MGNNHPSRPTGQGPSHARLELAAKAAIFGTDRGQGYIPAALTLMTGQPTAAELDEAEELLTLASLEVRRWRRHLTDEPIVAAV